MSEYYDLAVAQRADEITESAIRTLIDDPGAIRMGSERFHVVVVNASAGAGKSYFIGSAAEAVVARYRAERAVLLVGTPTNDQAYQLVRSLAQRLPGTTIAFVPAQNRSLPAETRAMPNVVEVAAVDAHHYTVVVGTLDKLSDAAGRGSITPKFRFLAIDEAYQADSSRYFGVAGLASRHLLVGDPGQLDPFTTMEDGNRWRGLAEDPLQTAVGVVMRNHPQIPVFRLPITRRLPASAVPLALAFYPGHAFSAWTLPGVRQLRFIPGASRQEALLDRALDLAASAGWAYVRLPDTQVLTADPVSIDVLTRLASRVRDRGAAVSSEATAGQWDHLALDRIAVAVSHNDQKDRLQTSLREAGLDQVRVDTANKLQGLEFDLVFAWHPLAGLPGADGFHLDPGRLCVMLTRHVTLASF